ncbi:hypothetical protein [Sporosarcina sp. FSL K6-1508]|uniref:hypothetical protein n=1 Tax=Sporosarcina sp. FSL K6-1508 TaxID=2921553 RepID=UPI0030F7D14A
MRTAIDTLTDRLFSFIFFFIGSIFVGWILYIVYGAITMLFVILAATSGGIVGFLLGAALDSWIGDKKNLSDVMKNEEV